MKIEDLKVGAEIEYAWIANYHYRFVRPEGQPPRIDTHEIVFEMGAAPFGNYRELEWKKEIKQEERGVTFQRMVTRFESKDWELPSSLTEGSWKLQKVEHERYESWTSATNPDTDPNAVIVDTVEDIWKCEAWRLGVQWLFVIGSNRKELKDFKLIRTAKKKITE